MIEPVAGGVMPMTVLVNGMAAGELDSRRQRLVDPPGPGFVRLTVMEARPMASRPHVGLVRSQWEVLNQKRETVLTMEGWGMFGRRENAPAVAQL